MNTTDHVCNVSRLDREDGYARIPVMIAPDLAARKVLFPEAEHALVQGRPPGRAPGRHRIRRPASPR